MAKPKAEKYSSPYKVLEWGNKAWKIQVGERVDIVSQGCLKPYIDVNPISSGIVF